MREPVEGPGGRWQAAVWFAGSNQFCPVMIPLDGTHPVVFDVAWSDPTRAADAAHGFACLAAEVVAEKV